MNLPLFSIRNIYPADFFHVRSVGRYGDAIRRVTGSVGTHDALFLNGHTVGESTVKPPRAHETDLEVYEDRMRKGLVTVSILRIPDISMSDRYAISAAWFRHVRGTPYDFLGIAKLFFKERAMAMLPEDSDFGEKAVGWEFAHWCTEGNRKACIMGSRLRPDGTIDPLAKENPTPRTVENRVRDGRLIDVTSFCLTEEGLQYRLQIPEKVG
jgi:hypothetical protein